jgi:hypothetical protein
MGSEEDAKPIDPRGERTPHFVLVAHQFWETLDTLRELHRSMGPVVAELDTKRFTWEEIVAVQGLTPEKQQRLVDYINRKNAAHERAEERLREEGKEVDPESRSWRASSTEDKEILDSIFGTDGEKVALARIRLKVRMARSSRCVSAPWRCSLAEFGRVAMTCFPRRFLVSVRNFRLKIFVDMSL